jgi:hypothetical protein
MLYRNCGFSFFGDFTVYPHLSTVSGHRSIEDSDFILHAGQVHGVRKGDEYALSLSELSENPTAVDWQAIQGKACLVDCTISRLVTVEPKDMEEIKKGSVWKTTLVSSISPRKIQI